MYAENGGIKPDDKYDQIYHQVKSKIPTDGFYIAGYNAQLDELDFKCINDEGIPYTEGPKDVFKKDWRLQQVMKEKKAQKFIIDPRLLEEKRPRDHRVGNLEKASPSILIAPILQPGGELIGVMSAQSYEPDVYVRKHLKMLSTIASQVAVVIQRVQRFQETLQETLMVGESQQMQRLYSLIKQVAFSDATVLIRGERGTGKELIARAIHEQSLRKDQPLVVVDCNIPEELVESELFGVIKDYPGFHRKEAHIGQFEIADGGTLFLDEVGELPRPVQAKLLRAIQEREIRPLGAQHPTWVDIRIIAATNRNLEEAMESGQFRKDLFDRLNVFPIEAPPLREHKDDIPLLIEHFLNLKDSFEISESARQKLIDYDYPGNVRELENILERASILNTDDIITPEAVGINTNRDVSQNLGPEFMPRTLRQALDLVEERYLKQVLQQTEGNKSQAAKKAGIDRKTLSNKAKKHNIDVESFKH